MQCCMCRKVIVGVEGAYEASKCATCGKKAIHNDCFKELKSEVCEHVLKEFAEKGFVCRSCYLVNANGDSSIISESSSESDDLPPLSFVMEMMMQDLARGRAIPNPNPN